jgi:metal-responsive CopG/Arc/MetJ family transcriptional regulator
MPIVFKDLIDQAVEKEGSNFSEFMRDAARMKLEKMNIEVKK